MHDCLAWINYCQTSACMCFVGKGGGGLPAFGPVAQPLLMENYQQQEINVYTYIHCAELETFIYVASSSCTWLPLVFYHLGFCMALGLPCACG